jgi:hypothetical protein
MVRLLQVLYVRADAAIQCFVWPQLKEEEGHGAPFEPDLTASTT